MAINSVINITAKRAAMRQLKTKVKGEVENYSG